MSGTYQDGEIGSTPDAAPPTTANGDLQRRLPAESPSLASPDSDTATPSAEPQTAQAGVASESLGGTDAQTQCAIRSPETVSQRPRSRWWVGVASVIAIVALLTAGAWALGNRNASSAQAGSSNTNTVVVVPPSAKDLQQTQINVIHTVQPSVVQVSASGSQGGGIGSGEILTSDGYIVTNDHVVAGFSSFGVTLASGQTLTAQLIGASPNDDLAVVKVSATGLRPIVFGDSNIVQVGQFALALGSPLGLEQSATQGIISALNRQASEGQNGPTLTGLIQTSAPINPGNSGGALVDLQGQLIGVPTLAAANPESGAPAAGIGFAIPSDRVKFVADQLIKNGRLINTGQGFLGIRGVDVTPQVAAAYNLPVQSGVVISGFSNDAKGQSPAKVAGLQVGDIIVKVDSSAIASQAELAGALLSRAPGTVVQVTVQRGTSQATVAVTLGERPASTAKG